MEAEEVDEIVVGAAGDHLEASQPIGVAAGIQRLDGPEVGDLLEEVDQVVGHRGIGQGAHAQLQCSRTVWCGRLGCHGLHRRDRFRLRRGERLLGRHRRGHFAALGMRADGVQQLARLDGVAASALMASQLGLQRVAAGQQNVDHRRRDLQLVAAQLVQQRLHLVRQLGDVGKAEGRGPAFDGVRASEDGVELLLVGAVDVKVQEHLLHALQVLAGLLEKDLVELAEVDAGREMAAFAGHVAHRGTPGKRFV